MKSKNVFALIIIFIILFSGCQNKEINVYNANGLARDENGSPIFPEKYIGLSVYGKNGEEIIYEMFIDFDYKKDISVADLSKDMCRELNIPIVFAGMGSLVYVQGINGLFEFDYGAESGWLYAVNGEFQGIGCGDYVLKNRDYVEWYYTLDLGKDVGNDFGIK
ncbi:MAG: DUF4430 domain-containing protein [Oscillospiraceae bacterium]|nr:DUF4430 domain-containing protein [Oscillospiraceae bacterium]